MTNKELILDCLMQDDEAFTQIVQFFKLVVEVEIQNDEVRKLLNEMVDENLIIINTSWKNEYNEYPYSLTEKGKKAWEDINWEDIKG